MLQHDMLQTLIKIFRDENPDHSNVQFGRHYQHRSQAHYSRIGPPISQFSRDLGVYYPAHFTSSQVASPPWRPENRFFIAREERNWSFRGFKGILGPSTDLWEQKMRTIPICGEGIWEKEVLFCFSSCVAVRMRWKLASGSTKICARISFGMQWPFLLSHSLDLSQASHPGHCQDFILAGRGEYKRIVARKGSWEKWPPENRESVRGHKFGRFQW